MQWRGLQYILGDRHSLECDWQLDIGHCCHSLLEDKGQHSAGFDMLSLRGIHCLLYILVCRQRKDLQSSQGCIDMIQQVLSECKRHYFHRGKDCKDPLSQFLVELKLIIMINDYNNKTISIADLRVVWRMQETKGFPVKPGSQVHWGRWFDTRQVAWIPQTPGQGFLHLLLTQALSLGHSALVTHSGLHST